jgi:hypothetical protein
LESRCVTRTCHEAKAGEVTWLALDILIFRGAGGVITGEVKVTEGSTHLGHHLLKLLLLVPEAVLLIIALAVVIPLDVVIHVGGVITIDSNLAKQSSRDSPGF